MGPRRARLTGRSRLGLNRTAHVVADVSWCSLPSALDLRRRGVTASCTPNITRQEVLRGTVP
jgi:hypothetical protein